MRIPIDKEEMIEIVSQYEDISEEFEVAFVPGGNSCTLHYVRIWENYYNTMPGDDPKIKIYNCIADLYYDYDRYNERILILRISAQEDTDPTDTYENFITLE